MTDEPTTLAEALARIAALEAELARLNERNIDLETRLILYYGTMNALLVPDEPIRIDYDIPPNAPR